MKSLVHRVFLLVLVGILSLACISGEAGASEFWGENISEEAVVFCENVWVFSGDCGYGVFDDNEAGFSRALGELWGLYSAIPARDKDLPEVTEAVDRLYSIMSDKAAVLSQGSDSDVTPASLVSRYTGMANQVMSDGLGFDSTRTAYFLAGLSCVVFVMIVLLRSVYDESCDIASDDAENV